MKLCVSDGFTFKYWFNVPDKMTVIEFHPILASYYGLKSENDLEYLRLSIVPPTSASNPWEMNLGDVKKNYLKKTDRFCDLPTNLINGQKVPLILVTGDTCKDLLQEKLPPQSQTPSEHYDPHVPKDIEDYEPFTPSILIYALALRATNREMIEVKSVLKEKLDLKSSVTLDVENSYGISSALSVSDFLQFIKTIFPLVNTTELKSHWSLNKPFVTVDDLDRILKICIFPTTHISFMTALHTAFELLDIPLTKSYPITGALRSQYVLETLEPLLKLMLEFAIRTAIDGGYLGVNAGFLPKKDSEKVLESLGGGGFLCRLSCTSILVSYIPQVNDKSLPEPFMIKSPIPSSDTSSVNNILVTISGIGDGYFFLDKKYPHIAAALIDNASFLVHPCLEASLLTTGFGSLIGKAAQRKHKYPLSVLLNMAVNQFAHKNDELDQTLLNTMRSVVLGELKLNELGRPQQSGEMNIILSGFCPLPEREFSGPPFVSNGIFAEYSHHVSSANSKTPRRYGFIGWHGIINYDETLRRLRNLPIGSYLLRDAVSQMDSFVLAFVDAAGKVTQSVIAPVPNGGGKVMCSGNTFPALQAVIIAYSTTQKAPEGSNVVVPALLKFPVPPVSRDVLDNPKMPVVNLFTISLTFPSMEVQGTSLSTRSLGFDQIAVASVSVSEVEEDPVPHATLEARGAHRLFSSKPTYDDFKSLWNIFNSGRPIELDEKTGIKTFSVIDKLRKSVIEGLLDKDTGLVQHLEVAINLPYDIELVLPLEDIHRLLDNKEGVHLKNFSEALKRLTHRFVSGQPEMSSLLEFLPENMIKKLVDYSTRTHFYVNDSTLNMIKRRLETQLVAPTESSAQGGVTFASTESNAITHAPLARTTSAPLVSTIIEATAEVSWAAMPLPKLIRTFIDESQQELQNPLTFMRNQFIYLNRIKSEDIDFPCELKNHIEIITRKMRELHGLVSKFVYNVNENLSPMTSSVTGTHGFFSTPYYIGRENDGTWLRGGEELISHCCIIIQGVGHMCEAVLQHSRMRFERLNSQTLEGSPLSDCREFQFKYIKKLDEIREDTILLYILLNEAVNRWPLDVSESSAPGPRGSLPSANRGA